MIEGRVIPIAVFAVKNSLFNAILLNKSYSLIAYNKEEK